MFQAETKASVIDEFEDLQGGQWHPDKKRGRVEVILERSWEGKDFDPSSDRKRTYWRV
jgi:hypothetical protein